MKIQELLCIIKFRQGGFVKLQSLKKQNFIYYNFKQQDKILTYKNSTVRQIKRIKMQNNQQQQFHHFIQLSANKNKEADKFAQFEYMQQTIRKNYKQVKKAKGDKNIRPPQKFTQYFKNLQKQQQIKYYQKCIKLLQTSISKQYSIQHRKLQRQNLKKQGQVYIKKSILNSWQKKKVKLQNLNFYIQQSKKLKTFPLKLYALRKSKNKQHYGWVLEFIKQQGKKKLKNVHCGVRNVKQFEEWFDLIDKSINSAKVDFYRGVILGLSAEQQPVKQFKYPEHNVMKTLTELAIDNQMKIHDQVQEIIEQVKNQEDNPQTPKIQMPVSHPNILKRLFEHVDITLFTQNSSTMTLIQNGPGYRLFQLPPFPGQDFRLRINIMLPYNKSLVFKALNQEMNLWNNQIDVFSIKTKISTENSALIYEKDKAHGLLYRQRDYLFVRHCFSTKSQNPNQKNKIFIADKSIDSINFPPFMTVARGQKRTIYCICGNQSQKQCMLIVDGLIKGGGYMNTANDKQMTIKFFKKFLGLQSYLKQKKFMLGNQKSKQTVFEQNWEVQQEQQEFFDLQNDDSDSDNESGVDSKQSPKKVDQNVRKLSSTSQPQNNQFDEFIKKTNQQHMQPKFKQQIKSQKSLSEQLSASQIFVFNTPEFASDKTTIIPQKYLSVKHKLSPFQKSKHPSYFPHYRGHHLWKGQWAICPTGGLNYVDQQKMNQQKKVLTFIIKRIGRNILSGKGILNISLPVDIFCRQSNIERLAASFGFAPQFLEKAATLTDPQQQMKYIISTAAFSSLIYLTMQKPFNPILGETYQSWIDGCPIYYQQICHHPPIAAYMMIGRGYKISGTVQAKMDLSINSGTGINEGIFTIEFDNGRKFYYTTAAGQLSGLTYGQRKLLFVGKTFFWCVQQGLFLELQYNPSSKNRRFFGGSNQTQGQAQFHDYFEGTLKKYKKQDLQEFLTPKKGDFRKIMAIPRACPTQEAQSQCYKVSGRWTKYISFNGTKMFDVDENRYYLMKDEQNPLPSHSNYRQDVIYRRLNDFVTSQQFKEVLQVKQRRDRKLRQTENNKK